MLAPSPQDLINQAFANAWKAPAPVVRQSRRKRRTRVADRMGDEEASSIISKVARTTLPPLTVAANILDLPRSTISDLAMVASRVTNGDSLSSALTKYNPVDQWLPWNWGDREHFTDSRDVMRDMGLISKEDTWKNFAGGLGVDILTDPLTYLSFGATAAARSGMRQVGTALGRKSTKELLRRAAKVAGMEGKGMMFRLKGTLDDVLKVATSREKDLIARHLASPAVADDALKAVKQAATSAGEGVYERIALQRLQSEYGKQAIGGIARWGLPDFRMFGATPVKQAVGKTFGTIDNPAARIAATALDSTLGRLGTTSAARATRALFDRTAFEMRSAIGQAFAPSLMTTQQQIRHEFKSLVNDVARAWSQPEAQNAMEKMVQAFSDVGGIGNESTIRRIIHEYKNPETLEALLSGRIPKGADAFDKMVAQAASAAELEPSEVEAILKAYDANDIVEETTYRLQKMHGVPIHRGDDRYIRHAPRFADLSDAEIPDEARHLYEEFAKAGEVPGAHASLRRRRKEFIDIPGGTATLFKLSTDPGVNEAIKKGLSVHEIAKAIERSFGNADSPWYIPNFLFDTPSPVSQTVVGQDGVQQVVIGATDRYERLARLLKGYSEKTRARGIFGNDPLTDLYHMTTGAADTAARAEFISDFLATAPGALRDDIPEAAGVTLRELLDDASPESLGLDTGWVARQILARKDPKRFSRLAGHGVEGFDEFNTLASDVASYSTGSAQSYQLGASEIAPGIAQPMYASAGTPIADPISEAMTEVLDMRIPHEVAKDLVAMSKAYYIPRASKKLAQFLDKMTSVFKNWQTIVSTKFHGRNILSGTAHNLMMLPIKPAQYAMDFLTTHRLLQGKDVKGLEKIPAIADRLTAKGIEATPESAAAELRAMVQELDLFETGTMADVAVGPASKRTGLEEFMQHHPGSAGPVLEKPGRRYLKGLAEITPGIGGFFRKTTAPVWQPIDAFQPLRKAWRKAKRTFSKADNTEKEVDAIFDAFDHAADTFFKVPAAAQTRGGFGSGIPDLEILKVGADASMYSEGMNRVAPFITLLRDGVDPVVAANMINDMHIRYDPRYFTSFERTWMKRLFPFYSFQSRMLSQTLNEHKSRPGGRMSTFLKAQKGLKTKYPLATHLSQGTLIPTESIPFIPKKYRKSLQEGATRYITGFGLMPEDSWSLLGSLARGDIRDIQNDLLSRANPLFRVFEETRTGRSVYQRGPLGGRELSSLDPPALRTIYNISKGIGKYTGFDPIAETYEQSFPGQGADIAKGMYDAPLTPRWYDQLLSLYPGRLLSEARRITDDRKRIPVKLLNQFLGLRITDVSPRAKIATTDEMMRAALRDLNAKRFTNFYVPKDVKAQMPPEKRMAIEAIEAVRAKLLDNAKRRAKGLPPRYKL